MYKIELYQLTCFNLQLCTSRACGFNKPGTYSDDVELEQRYIHCIYIYLLMPIANDPILMGIPKYMNNYVWWHVLYSTCTFIPVYIYIYIYTTS